MLEKNSSQNIVRTITTFLFTAVIAGVWDVWWHTAIGRDTLWEPPHILLYGSTMLAIIFGVWYWRKTRTKVWRNLALVLLLIPISAPFDELWHRFFGVENLSSPLIVWSPPHLAIIATVIMSFFFLLPLIQEDKDQNAKTLFSSLALVGILEMGLFALGPIYPTGPFELLGFWGVFFVVAWVLFVLMYGEKRFKGIGASSLIILMYLSLAYIPSGSKVALDIKLAPHDHAPNFITTFAFLSVGLILDLTRGILPNLLRYLLSGTSFTLLLFIFSRSFFESEFQWSNMDSLIAVISAIVASICVSVIEKVFVYKSK